MDLNLEKLLDDVIENLCRGEQRKYQGVLILFDELNAYLQNWVADSHAAGGMALQKPDQRVRENINRVKAGSRLFHPGPSVQHDYVSWRVSGEEDIRKADLTYRARSERVPADIEPGTRD